MKQAFFIMALLIAHNIFAQTPSIKVLDTNFSKGTLNHKQTVTLKDVAKFHDYLCDGIVVGF